MLDLSVAFDTVDHDILLKRLDSRFYICGTARDWFRSYLTNSTQFALIDGWEKTQYCELKCGMPEGSCPWTHPVATLNSTKFISSLTILNYLSLFHQTTTWSIIAKIQDCLSDLDEWMFLNKLKVNKDKTVVLYFYSKHCPIKSLPPLRFGNDTINPFDSARNIGAIFDRTMSMLSHVNLVCKSALYHLRYIFLIRKFLSSKTTEILVHALVSPKLDCCNSLLYNVPKYVLKKLQSAQNAASLLITCFRKYDYVTPVLSDLH